MFTKGCGITMQILYDWNTHLFIYLFIYLWIFIQDSLFSS